MQRKSGRTRVTRLPQEKVYHLLEPGPVVLLTTSQKGKANVMTMSWHMMMDFVPPRVACVVSEKQLQFHRAPSHQRVRYRGAARRVGAPDRGDRQYIRARYRQVRPLSPDAAPSAERRGAFGGRMLCQSGMSGHQYASGEKVQLVCFGRRAGLGRCRAKAIEDSPSSRIRQVRNGRRRDHAQVGQTIAASDPLTGCVLHSCGYTNSLKTCIHRGQCERNTKSSFKEPRSPDIRKAIQVFATRCRSTSL